MLMVNGSNLKVLCVDHIFPRFSIYYSQEDILELKLYSRKNNKIHFLCLSKFINTISILGLSMINTSFNILDEPWIQVRDEKNKIVEISLIQTLNRCHEFKQIYNPSPLIEYGIHRFIIAFISDVLKINTIEDISDIFLKKKFSHPDIWKKILDYAEEWHDRFDLFDTNHPFYQTPKNKIPKKIKKKNKINSKTIKELFPFFPVGTNKIFQYYVKNEELAISPAMCARTLCYLPPFISSGGQGYFPGINGSSPWYVLVLGKNLFETIILNCCGFKPNSGNQSPIWCLNKDSDNIENDKEISTVAGFTYFPRVVNLIPQSGGICSISKKASSVLVKNIFFTSAPKYSGKWKDPHLCYIHTKKKEDNIEKEVEFPLRPLKDRKIWRDIGSILLLMPEQLKESDKIKFEKPLVVQQFRLLQDNKIIDENLPVRTLLYSLHTRPSQKKYFKMEKVSLTLPVSITKKPWSGTIINKLMGDFETGSSVLKKSILSTEFLNLPLDDILYQFWVDMEHYFYEDFLSELSNQDEMIDENDQIVIDWKNKIKETGSKIISDLFDRHKLKSKNIRKQINALNMFNGILHKSFFGNNRR